MLEGHAPLLHNMGLVVLDAAAHDLFLDEAVQNQTGQHQGDGSRGEDDRHVQPMGHLEVRRQDMVAIDLLRWSTAW